MTQPQEQEPYIAFKPGDLIAAEDMVDIQKSIRADLAANTAADQKNVAELKELIANVDAPKFGGETPDEWKTDLDQRYIRRDDPQAAGQYRRYFKQLNRKFVNDAGEQSIEPAVIKHNLCRYPIVEIYELAPLFSLTPAPSDDDRKKLGLPDNWETVKFLLYYATKRDPAADLLFTEADDRYYWGDPVGLWIDQFGLKPGPNQSFDDFLNDLWGKMFDPGNEQDEFDRNGYGNSPYTQNWIDKNNATVGDLIKGRQWDDLRIAIRPQLLSASMVASANREAKTQLSIAIDSIREKGLKEFPNGIPLETNWDVRVYHLSQNAIEIHVPQAMELMVLIRT